MFFWSPPPPSWFKSFTHTIRLKTKIKTKFNTKSFNKEQNLRLSFEEIPEEGGVFLKFFWNN